MLSKRERRTAAQNAAASRRADRAVAQSTMRTNHKRHRALADLGIKVVNPANAVGIVARVDDDDDLLRAAEELGIDLSGVHTA